ncbi:MAG: DUF4384 domain-containing protein [Gemmatimonadetes bacterium]|nr:DUF4384 domain-containing protein [Gemmatimonadota bacterium]
MKTLFIAVALTLLQVGAAVAQYGSYPPSQHGPRAGGYGNLRGWGYTPEARIWIDGNRDFYRRGERLRATFSTSADAYVAVIHIDPDGRLEFLYPSAPGDREYVLGGRSYPLPYRAANSGWLVRSGPGIGYLYLIASPVPLDYGYFRGRGSSMWDWSHAGQSVRGDPFWAMEQITRYLVPDWGYTPVAVDYFSYQVDGLHRYPSYACSSRFAQTSSWGWGYGGGYVPSYYGACDRLDYYLRDNPYYFDAGRYRGDRRTHFRGYGTSSEEYRYKENPARGTTGRTGTARGVSPSTGGTTRGGDATTVPTRRPAAEPSAPAAEPARGTTAPSRPTPQVRRAPSGSGDSGGSSGGGATSEPRRRTMPD